MDGLSGLGKFGAVVAVLVIGIDVYSRWTGQSFGPINLLGQNPLGASTLTAAQASAQVQQQQEQQARTGASAGAAVGSAAGSAAGNALAAPGSGTTGYGQGPTL